MKFYIVQSANFIFVNMDTYGIIRISIFEVTASDIAGVLRNNAINSTNVEEWLASVDSDSTKKRLATYYNKMRELQTTIRS